MTVRTRRRLAAAATTVALASGGAVLTGAAPAQAACPDPVMQYELTGQDGTVRNPDMVPIGTWYRGYVINTYLGGRQEGYTYGNVYTADRRPVATGFVVSAYLRHLRSFCV